MLRAPPADVHVCVCVCAVAGCVARNAVCKRRVSCDRVHVRVRACMCVVRAVCGAAARREHAARRSVRDAGCAAQGFSQAHPFSRCAALRLAPHLVFTSIGHLLFGPQWFGAALAAGGEPLCHLSAAIVQPAATHALTAVCVCVVPAVVACCSAQKVLLKHACTPVIASVTHALICCSACLCQLAVRKALCPSRLFASLLAAHTLVICQPLLAAHTLVICRSGSCAAQRIGAPASLPCCFCHCLGPCPTMSCVSWLLPTHFKGSIRRVGVACGGDCSAYNLPCASTVAAAASTLVHHNVACCHLALWAHTWIPSGGHFVVAGHLLFSQRTPAMLRAAHAYYTMHAAAALLRTLYYLGESTWLVDFHLMVLLLTRGRH